METKFRFERENCAGRKIKMIIEERTRPTFIIKETETCIEVTVGKLNARSRGGRRHSHRGDGRRDATQKKSGTQQQIGERPKGKP